ncbi:MAG: ATP-binding protein [Bacteroidales bacterium]
MKNYEASGDKDRKIKELEAELTKEQAEKQDLLQIIDNLDSQIFRCQKDTKNEYIITFNEGKVAYLNDIHTSKVQNNRIRDIIGEELYSQLEPYYNQAFNGKTARYRGFEFNGRTYSTVLSPFKKDENGNVVEAVGITQEVTEQYRIEENYRKEKDILDRIIEYNPYSIQILDAKGRHLRKNKAFDELFGAAPDENWSIFKDPNLIEGGFGKQLAKLYEGKIVKMPPVWYNAHKVDEDYPDIPVCLGSVIFPIFLSNGQLEHIVIMHENITERTKAKEELIIAKEKAEESDRLKSSFLANLSHEIRTPMNGIFGFAELLREKGIDEQEKEEYINVIKDSGKRMMTIIDDLVSISRIESGQMQIANEKVNINELLDDLYKFYEHEWKQEAIDFQLNIKDAKQPLYINSDKEKLYEVISNLLKNAFRFTEKGKIEFGYQLKKEKNQIQFYVKDTGRGISPEQHYAIFKRFVQADTSLSKDHEGAGLGLPIAKAYVEIMGGKMWVKSEKGKGSAFYFSIPLNIPDQANIAYQQQMTEIVDLIEDATILVADDDEGAIRFFKDALPDDNINLLVSRTGKEAIEICKQHHNIQLVFMDTKMPVMDGYTAAQYIRDLRPDMPIVALTAFSKETETEGFYDIFTSYLLKPIDKETLMITLANFLAPD